MKTFLLSLAFLPLFLFAAPQAFAINVTNFSFDHDTQDFSFDYTGYTAGDIGTESVVIGKLDGSNWIWRYNYEAIGACTGGSSGSGTCSGTSANSTGGTFACDKEFGIWVYGYNATEGFNVTSNPDPDCLTVTNFSFDHDTGVYSFDYSGYHGGNIATESTYIRADNSSWQYNDEPASCTGGSTGSGTCSGTTSYTSGTFNCGSVRVGVYGYNPGDEHQVSITNPDPDC
jgi:hypothetical protein